MSNLAFRKATLSRARLRLALIGPAGSGKTYSALAIASHMAGPVAVVDTERGSASKYAKLFLFDVLELETFAPDTYVEAIQVACKAGYGTIIVDSLSHAWMGRDGALEQVDRAAKRSQSGNSFTAWRDVTPMHNRLVDAMIGADAHLIVTIRTKTEYVLEKDERTGKTTPKKVGLAPIQREGLEYEFDVVGDMNLENDLVVGKTRCPAVAGKVFPRPGKAFGEVLAAWLSDGEAPTPRPAVAAPPVAVAPKAAPEAEKLYEELARKIILCGSEEELKRVWAEVGAAAKRVAITLEMRAVLSGLKDARKVALKASPPVHEVLAGNPMPEGWGGQPAAESKTHPCVTCGKVVLGGGVATHLRDGVVGIRHLDCPPFGLVDTSGADDPDDPRNP